MKVSNCAINNCTILLISFILNYFASAIIPLTKHLSSSLLSKYNPYLFIKTAFQFIINGYQLTNVRPTQFFRQCLTNWIIQIELVHIIEIGMTISLYHPRRVRLLTSAQLIQNTKVSIHAPTQGATWFYSQNILRNLFQSTHPRRVRRTQLIVVVEHGRVSIHAPMQGATIEPHALSFGIPVSIHAPTQGATPNFLILCCSVQVSIHAPTQGAT